MALKKLVVVAGLASVLAGCNAMPQGLFGQREQSQPNISITPSLEEGQVPEDATTVEDFDTTSEDDRAAALEGATSTGGETDLGTTIASLGDVTEAGFWLKTPLVSEPAKGRVQFTENGKAVVVDLIPLEGEPGAGSRISLAAMRLLDVDLTALAELKVFRMN